MSAGTPTDSDTVATPTRVPHISAGHLLWLRRVFALLQAVSPSLAARFAFRLFLRTFRHPLRPEDAAVLARARRHHLVTAEGDPFALYEWGAGERLAIILHGWGSGAARFTQLADALVVRGWRVLVPDAPGHGASPGKSSSLPKFMAALDAIAAQFGAPGALVGHSLGALAIARRHAAGAPPWASQLQAVVLVSMPSGAPFLLGVFMQALGLRPTTRARLQALFERRFNASVASFATLPGTRHIGARVLLVHDGGDDIVPLAHSMELQRQVPAAQLLQTSGLGHSALTRDAATITRIAEFLDAAS